jgi:ribosomal protein S10
MNILVKGLDNQDVRFPGTAYQEQWETTMKCHTRVVDVLKVDEHDTGSIASFTLAQSILMETSLRVG